jgi:hypothetical protein
MNKIKSKEVAFNLLNSVIEQIDSDVFNELLQERLEHAYPPIAWLHLSKSKRLFVELSFSPDDREKVLVKDRKTIRKFLEELISIPNDIWSDDQKTLDAVFLTLEKELKRAAWLCEKHEEEEDEPKE